MTPLIYDTLIVGGGPGGLSAALALGRARKRVLLCDAGPRRNAAATLVHNFLTRDGTPPSEMRALGRRDLAAYPAVELRDVHVEAIAGERGAFDVRLGDGARVRARRVLLATGMIDELPDVDGYRELWGASIFQCPYCHGWEVRDRRWAFLAPGPEMLDFALFLRGWTGDVTLLTDGRFALPAEAAAQLARGRVRVDERRIRRYVAKDGHLAAVGFADGTELPLDVLFARPPQRQVPVVAALGLAVDAGGYVTVDARRSETSRPGIFAAGDLTTPIQGAVLAASAGMLAAAMINHDLNVEGALAGWLD